MNQKKKKDFYQTLHENIGKRVLISYKSNGKDHEDLLVILRVDAIGLIALNKDNHRVEINHEDLKSVDKKPISFMPITVFLENPAQETGKSNLINQSVEEIVRSLKRGKEYLLQTRSAMFHKNGSLHKQKKSAYALEILSYKWLNVREKTLICPIAMLNQNRLIALRHDGQFVVLNNRGKIVHNRPTDKIMVSINEGISSFNEKDPKSLAERLL